MSALFVVAMAVLLPVQQADTTFAVRQGMRLDVRNQEGEIRITAWQRDQIRVTAGRTGSGAFSVDQSGSILRVRPERGGWRESTSGTRRRFEWDDSDPVVDFDIMVPAYMALTLRGVETDIVVDGVIAEITAETVEGVVDVRGGAGILTLSSAEGLVRVDGPRGRIEASSGDGDVFIRNAQGDINANSVDGDVSLSDIDSRNVTVSTVDGDVSYSGTIYDRGRYRLSTHDGNVTLSVPENTNATVTVTSYDGDFQTSFPIVLRESRQRRFSFTLGDGSAVVELESFDGDIYLRRR